jgi:hypothetical protein
MQISVRPLGSTLTGDSSYIALSATEATADHGQISLSDESHRNKQCSNRYRVLLIGLFATIILASIGVRHPLSYFDTREFRSAPLLSPNSAFL